jgi:hypothetical protein
VSTAQEVRRRRIGPPSGVRTALGRPWLLTVGLATALCAAYLVGALVNWGEAADRSLYANLGMIPIGLAATILALTASQTQPARRARLAWGFIGLGLACFWAGDVLFFAYQNILGFAPFPSPADLGYLAYYPLVFVGLLCFPRLPASRARRAAASLAAIAIVVAGSAVILSVFLLPTLFAADRDDLLSSFLSIGYPLGDVLLLGGLAWAFLSRISESRWTVCLLSAGLVVGLAADVLYGYQGLQGALDPGGLSDAAYMLSWALFAWAGYTEATHTASFVPEAVPAPAAGER